MTPVESQQRPKPPIVAQMVSCVGFFLLYIPLITLVVYSFLGPSSEVANEREWTLVWYRKLSTDQIVLDSLVLSLSIAFWSTIGATFLGTTAALALERARFPGRKFFEVLSYVPLIMPEIVLGLSLLVWFVLLRITLGSFSIILAHITFSVSYVMITVKARLTGFDMSLEEAAQDLGASHWQTFWKVTFPLIWPGVLSGALMAFTLSFDDFLITFFTAGVGSDTLPLKIYSMIKFGVSPEINALSTLLLGITLILVVLLFKPLKKT